MRRSGRSALRIFAAPWCALSMTAAHGQETSPIIVDGLKNEAQPAGIVTLDPSRPAADALKLLESERPPAALEGPLTASAVLQSSAEHFPQILQAIAERRAVEGKALSALGAFDLVFSASGSDYLNGFYDGRIVGGEVSQALRPFGGKVYGGYRVSDGRFPVYEDENFTNSGGELKIGALFSLLRDRAIDDRRFLLRDTGLELRQADLDVLLTRIGVQQRALVAYWRWVTAGRQLAVYEELLDIALGREGGLEEQVRRGARARIFITENRQNITRRQRLVVEARREFQNAANDLSFYLRSATGEPVTPTKAQLPPPRAAESMEAIGQVEGRTLSETLARRPELEILRTGVERAQGRIALGRNELKPRLDVKAEVANDFGDVAEGGVSRDSTDVVVGFDFSVPLQRRDARGKVVKAEAELEALRQQRRQAVDRIEIEVRNILLDLNVAEQIYIIAGQEADQAETMRRAEIRRFDSGASDFFLVNIREETAADARIRLYNAELQARIARANYDAAVVDLDRLLIADDDPDAGVFPSQP